MHQSYPLLEILAAGFTFALIFGYLAKRLGLSPIVGYLAAGFLVGPHSPGFVADISLAMELSEAGVILLMFGVGLHFHLEDLLAVKGVSLPGALVQSTASTLCGFAVAELAGLSVVAGMVMGMGLAVASTVVLLRILEDNHMLDTVHGHVAVGWLIVEDILTVLVLVLLPSIAVIANAPAGENAGVLPMLAAMGMAVLRLALLWVIVLVIGGRVVPWILVRIVRTRSQELFTLTILVAAFATAVGAAVFFEASVALGAFLGGMVVGKSRLSYQAGAELLPFKDAFSVLFFLSVGMLIDPSFIVERPFLILTAIVIVLVVKPIAAITVVALLGYTARTGLVVGVSLAQVGEFSFILAQTAYSLKIIPMDVYNVLAVTALVSITLNPGLFSLVPKFEAALKKHPVLWKVLNIRAEHRLRKKTDALLTPAAALPNTAEAIVVGYGPTGRSVVKGLRDKGVAATVIDMNVDTVNYLNENGCPAVYGNSARPEILKAAEADKAQYLILTLPERESTAATIAAARELNAELRILARTRFLNDRTLLKSAGATTVVYEEEEVARVLTDTVLEDIRLCREEQACPLYENEPV